MAYHNELGEWGEEFAANYLLTKGYEILERNYFYDRAEVDIIASPKERDSIVCVEVKTRNSDVFGDPQSFVTQGKIKLLVKAMDTYMVTNNITLEVRFDIIAIIKNKSKEELTHYKDAFYYF
ncbi:YraN family protein [Xanthomarina sp. F1114]|uniref:YraN family protein n=1 Tax=Xanthomarina sp. F1114 TaxID=2996019 RepID=UPI00225E26B3|nr:YraN family protein [Xanthomarina sp. F1114]MCX7548497.1 YraN family protein [Xanthomarina sp. F1114]